jgi:hypothetical protein
MSGMTRINSRIYLQIFRVNEKTSITRRWKRDGRSHYIRIVSTRISTVHGCQQEE